MSRRLNPSARGRASQPTGGRGPQLRLTFGGKSGQKNGARETTTLGRKITKRKVVRYSDANSTSSGGDPTDSADSTDDDSEEADDESEDPDVDVPSRYTPLRGGMGPPLMENDSILDNGEWAGFPEPEPELPGLQDVQVGLFDVDDFEKNLFNSDDDQVYERVHEVSDSDNDDDEAVQRAETELLTTEFGDDLTSHFANQIDGMSAYGFGDASDEEGSVFFPFSSGDEANDSQTRHVHFEEQDPLGMAAAFAALADSPTMTRALLPSALPDTNDEALDEEEAVQDNDYDTDATEELEEPAKQWKCAVSSQKSSNEDISPPPLLPKRTSIQRGPVRGVFEDNGDKVTAVLDPTGRKLLLSDPHLLGGVFARRFGPSVPASPSVSFSDAVFGESDSSQASASPRPQSAQLANFDHLLAGPAADTQVFDNRQATGNLMPASSSFLNELVDGDIFNGESFDPEATLRIEDMIAFDGDTDDDETIDSPIVPNPFNAHSLSAPGTPLAHLNHFNVTAFKRNSEAVSFGSSPAPMRKKILSPLKRKRRSTRNDSPYNHSHYDGVTPVQRISALAHEHELSSSPAPTSRMHKRRKTIL